MADRVCATCDETRPIRAKGECSRCYSWRRAHDGQPRPRDLGGRPAGELATVTNPTVCMYRMPPGHPREGEPCGKDHERCTSHVQRGSDDEPRERWGEPCHLWPMQDQDVCGKHGGKAPQNIAGARQRRVEREATTALRRRLGDMSGVAPITDPVNELGRIAGEIVAWKDEVHAMVAELTDLASRADDEDNDEDTSSHPLVVPAAAIDIHPLVKLAERAQARAVDVLGEMQKLGIAEAYLNIEQSKADLLGDVLRHVLTSRGEDPQPFLVEVAAELRRRDAVTATATEDLAG